MGAISVRIDEKMKKTMESMKHINWSEILRQAITRTIQNEYEHDMARAVLLNDKIKKKAPDGFNSVDIIRRFREERFGEKKG